MTKKITKFTLILFMLFQTSMSVASNDKYLRAMRAYENLFCETTVELLKEYIAETKLSNDNQQKIQTVIDWCIAFDKEAVITAPSTFSVQGVMAPPRIFSHKQTLMIVNKPKLPLQVN